MRLNYLLFFFTITFFSCKSTIEVKNNPEIIDLTVALAKGNTLGIGELTNQIDYVRLETNNECLTGPKLKVYSNEKYILTIDRNKMLLFDKITGSFIREIGKKGRSPEAYMRTFNVMPFNEEKNSVYAGGNNRILEYSVDGELIKSIPSPELTSEIGNFGNDTFVAYLPNFQGEEKRRLIVFDESGAILHNFPNYFSAPNSGAIVIWNPHSWFYKLDNQLCFYELFTDTLYQVTPDTLIPRFVFKMGEWAPPYENQTVPGIEPEKYFFMNTVNESSRYLFCSFNFDRNSYTVVFDKNTRKTYVYSSLSEEKSGFIDNMNSFVPLQISGINNNDEIICIIEANRIKQWFAKNPDKIDQLPLSVKSLNSVNETDNPVIMIAQLKK